MEEKRYIHYGCSEFDLKKFIPIKNREFFSKPYGGFWASPVDAAFGWKDWNEANDFAECDSKNAFIFTLTPEARILHLENREDFDGLPEIESIVYGLDFEKLMEMGYDGVEMKSNWTTHDLLYGWDCDSILIMNPNVIKY